MADRRTAGTRRAAHPPGYGWDGGSGTVWRNDPFTGLTGILFTQLQLRSPEPPAVFTDFWDAAYSALDG